MPAPARTAEQVATSGRKGEVVPPVVRGHGPLDLRRVELSVDDRSEVVAPAEGAHADRSRPPRARG